MIVNIKFNRVQTKQPDSLTFEDNLNNVYL